MATSKELIELKTKAMNYLYRKYEFKNNRPVIVDLFNLAEEGKPDNSMSFVGLLTADHKAKLATAEIHPEKQEALFVEILEIIGNGYHLPSSTKKTDEDIHVKWGDGQPSTSNPKAAEGIDIKLGTPVDEHPSPASFSAPQDEQETINIKYSGILNRLSAIFIGIDKGEVRGVIREGKQLVSNLRTAVDEIEEPQAGELERLKTEVARIKQLVIDSRDGIGDADSDSIHDEVQIPLAHIESTLERLIEDSQPKRDVSRLIKSSELNNS